MLFLCILIALFCAIQTAHAPSLLIASLWLGGVSVAVAVSLYIVGATGIAVIELSVSAGLVMVLLVFAITVLGDATTQISRIHIGYLITMSGVAFILILLTLPELQYHPTDDSDQLATILWHERSLDVLLQITLLFAGALAVLSFLSSSQLHEQEAADDAVESDLDDSPDAPLVLPEPDANLEKEPV